jgi:hypothetical protein
MPGFDSRHRGGTVSLHEFCNSRTALNLTRTCHILLNVLVIFVILHCLCNTVFGRNLSVSLSHFPRLAYFSALKMEVGKCVPGYMASYPIRSSTGNLNRTAFEMSNTQFSEFRIILRSCFPYFNRPSVPQHVPALCQCASVPPKPRKENVFQGIHRLLAEDRITLRVMIKVTPKSRVMPGLYTKGEKSFR